MMPPTSEIQFDNKSSGSSFGFELAADWKPGDWISFQFGYTYLELDLDVNDGELGLDEVVVYKDSSPQHGVSLRSTIDIAQDLQMTMLLRYVDQFSAAGIEALSSQSIVDEYVAPLTVIEQSIYGKLIYSF
jgi:outer membrane receptor protein involved in Fe transport